MITRRRFLGTTALTGAGLFLPPSLARRAYAAPKKAHGTAPVLAEALLDPATQGPKFVNPLPRPATIDATRGGRLNVAMRETTQFLGLVDPDTGRPLTTAVWGYRYKGQPTYPGATIVARRGTPLEVRWQNQLKEERPPWQAHLLPVDTTLHLATPEREPKQGVPLVTHLHGGHSESASDGLPEAWFTKNFKETGPHFVKELYRYDNDQEAATLWYHDHALGITRLNVYAGLAGFYLLRDDNENELITQGYLPSGPFEIGLAIQDRMFTADGQLFLPHEDPEIDAEHYEEVLGEQPEPFPEGSPSIIAEFFDDPLKTFILVNGMVWPKLQVTPDRYRFRALNGSDSRFYILKLQDASGNDRPFFVIGGDGGFLHQPVEVDELLIAPGERYDLVVDFGAYTHGTDLFLRNFGPDEPFKGLGVGDPAEPSTTGQVMKFEVRGDPLGSAPLWDPDVILRSEPFSVGGTAAKTRHLFLFEGLDEFGRLQPLLGTLEQGSLGWFEPITENPGVGDVEEWWIYNTTEDAHPIHLHLVQFELLDRQSAEVVVENRPQPQHDGSFGVGKDVVSAITTGDPRDSAPHERSAKDTAVMLPGEVTRIRAKFDRPGRYVWHCHILSHEDHEMMRPYHVGPITG